MNSQTKDGLTPLHMAHMNIQSVKYAICQYCTSNKNKKIKMTAIYGHFRNFQGCTTIFTKMTNYQIKQPCEMVSIHL